jgi:creatinine amidohydrolase/Fe(II)-dependent formamide hydrolase-like protein
MRFPGTITLPEEFFRKVLEFAARSLQAHGFLDIVLIGDSGGNQAGQRAVADALNLEWSSTPVRVHHIEAYYNGNVTDEWLRQQGESAEAIGSHASIPDTSQLLALYPEGVRRDKLAPGRANDGSGVSGDPTRATAATGKKGLELKIATGVRDIRALAEPQPGAVMGSGAARPRSGVAEHSLRCRHCRPAASSSIAGASTSPIAACRRTRITMKGRGQWAAI